MWQADPRLLPHFWCAPWTELLERLYQWDLQGALLSDYTRPPPQAQAPGLCPLAGIGPVCRQSCFIEGAWAGRHVIFSTGYSTASLPSLLPLPLCCFFFPPYYLQTGIFQAWGHCPSTHSPWLVRTGCPHPFTNCGSTAPWGARSQHPCHRMHRPCSTW